MEKTEHAGIFLLPFLLFPHRLPPKRFDLPPIFPRQRHLYDLPGQIRTLPDAHGTRLRRGLRQALLQRRTLPRGSRLAGRRIRRTADERFRARLLRPTAVSALRAQVGGNLDVRVRLQMRDDDGFFVWSGHAHALRGHDSILGAYAHLSFVMSADGRQPDAISQRPCYTGIGSARRTNFGQSMASELGDPVSRKRRGESSAVKSPAFVGPGFWAVDAGATS